MYCQQFNKLKSDDDDARKYFHYLIMSTSYEYIKCIDVISARYIANHFLLTDLSITVKYITSR